MPSTHDDQHALPELFHSTLVRDFEGKPKHAEGNKTSNELNHHIRTQWKNLFKFSKKKLEISNH